MDVELANFRGFEEYDLYYSENYKLVDDGSNFETVFRQDPGFDGNSFTENTRVFWNQNFDNILLVFYSIRGLMNDLNLATNVMLKLKRQNNISRGQLVFVIREPIDPKKENLLADSLATKTNSLVHVFNYSDFAFNPSKHTYAPIYELGVSEHPTHLGQRSKNDILIKYYGFEPGQIVFERNLSGFLDTMVNTDNSFYVIK